MTARSKNVFTPVILAIALTITAISAASLTLGAAGRYLSELNIRTPEISKHRPLIGYAPPRTSRRVVLVIIDGLRLTDSFGTDTLERLRRFGVDAIGTSHYPSISRPNHTTLVTGVPPLMSGVRNNTFGAPVLVDSLMDRMKAAGLTAAFVADDSPSLAFLFGDDFEALYYSRWPGGFSKSTRRAIERDESDFLVLIPGSVDVAGHEYGADSPEYRQAIQLVDRQLQKSLQLIDLTTDTIIVTADHGHTDAGGHGGEEREVLQVPLVIAGAGIDSTALLGTTGLIDVAPTVAALLGVPAPGHSVGHTLTEVLLLSGQEKQLLAASDERRIARNTGLYEKHLASSQVAREQFRQSRIFRLLLFVFSAILVFLLALRFGAMLLDWRVLLIALPAYPLVYYGFLHVLGDSLSFSVIKDQGSGMNSLFRFGILATFVQFGTGWLALAGRVELRDRLAAANALIAAGLFFAMLAAGILWVYHGPPPHAAIPSSTIALLIPANYVAVGTYAVGASLLLLLEIVVFFARAVDPRIHLRRLERAAQKQRDQLDEVGSP